jgi:CO dehydrogenase maturation factor
MKIAISGKGGVGKTLLASILARILADDGYSVIAIDADPDANLTAALGFPGSENIVPISEMKELIAKRTETGQGKTGSYFKINPHVEDIPDKYSLVHDGIRLLVMGAVKKGGSGCYCPENTLLSTLLAHLLITRKEVVILDMAAGIEHLSRGTARAVDKLIIVVEPGRSSIETAGRIKKLAGDIGITNIAFVGNKIRSEQEKDFILRNLPGAEVLGFIPYDPAVTQSDIAGLAPSGASQSIIQAVGDIYRKLIATSQPDR